MYLWGVDMVSWQISKVKSFYVNDLKHHVVEVISDGENTVVLHKCWSKSKQRWNYFADSDYYVEQCMK